MKCEWTVEGDNCLVEKCLMTSELRVDKVVSHQVKKMKLRENSWNNSN